MFNCFTCGNELQNGANLVCPNCGAIFCTTCGTTTKNICPYCYSSLDLK